MVGKIDDPWLIVMHVVKLTERFAHETADHVGYAASGGLYREQETVLHCTTSHQGISHFYYFTSSPVLSISASELTTYLKAALNMCFD